MPESWAGTLHVARGTQDEEDYIWLEYVCAQPGTALLSRLDRDALFAIREALAEDAVGFTYAIKTLCEALAPGLLEVDA